MSTFHAAVAAVAVVWGREAGEGNRRSSVALAILHKICRISIYRINGLGIGAPVYIPSSIEYHEYAILYHYTFIIFRCTLYMYIQMKYIEKYVQSRTPQQPYNFNK